MSQLDKVLYHVRYGYLSKLWPVFSNVLIKTGGPKLAAYLSYLAIDWGEKKTGTKTILCLSRALFEKDVAELRKRGDFNYVMVKGGYIRFQEYFTSNELQTQSYYQRELNNHQTGMLKCTQYAKYLTELVEKRCGSVDGILSANFDYWQDHSFKLTCKEKDIPFLTLSREHPIIPKICKIVYDDYRMLNYKYLGDAIAVAGESSQRVLWDSKVVDKKEKIRVTGLPRYDAWRDLNVINNARQYVTLLTFTSGYWADDTFLEVLELLVKVADKNPSTPFYVKTKDDLDTHILKQHLSNNTLPENLVFGHEIPLFELLPQSKLVINYNSLALVEAALAKADILLPAWGQCKSSGDDVMYTKDNTNVSNLAKFAENSGEFERMIQNSIDQEFVYKEHDTYSTFVNEFVYISDSESSSVLFERYITQFI